MEYRFLVHVLPLLILLPLGALGGGALMVWFDERFDVQNDYFLQLVSLSIYFVACGIVVCVYLIWLSAIKRMIGPATPESAEADFDDRP